MQYLRVLPLLLAPVIIASAQMDVEFEHVRELNARVLQLYASVQTADPIQQPLLASSPWPSRRVPAVQRQTLRSTMRIWPTGCEPVWPD